MKQMKKLFFVTSFLMVMVLAPQVMADQIKSYQQIGYSYSNGGEFTVHIEDNIIGPDLNSVLTYYAENTKNIGSYNPSFQTFCIEKMETFSPGTLYDVTISNNAIYGGVYPQVDPISKGTAWLYQQFALGILTNYDYTAGTNRSNDADLLQRTIWWLEGEGNDPGDKFKTQVTTAVLGYTEDNNGYYPVMALNLWDVGYAGIDGHQRQDQLVLVPEPATMLFMGVGLLGMAGFLRKKFKK